MPIAKKVKSFVRRVTSGEVVPPLYLTYYFLYLTCYDIRFRTRFSISHAPHEIGRPALDGSTGNFPGHPRLIRRLFELCELQADDAILDVGHGSGMVLHVAHRMGFRNLSGIEYGDAPYALSLRNLPSDVKVMHGDALALDMSPYSVIVFFNPFRGERVVTFFTGLPRSVHTVLAMNPDPVLGSVLTREEFALAHTYRHHLYRNFNAQVWKRVV